MSQDWRGRGQLRNLLQHLCQQPGSGCPGSGEGGDILLPQAQGRRCDFTQCTGLPEANRSYGDRKWKMWGRKRQSSCDTHKATVGY